MPRTPSVTAHSAAPGAALRLFGAVTALVLATGCSGGGGSDGPEPSGTNASASVSGDLGSSPPVEGGPGQPSAPRSSAGGNGGGFNAAGQVSPNVSGVWPSAVVEVTNVSKEGPLTVSVSQVTDCTGGRVSATASPVSPSDPTKSVAVGATESFVFAFSGDPAGPGDRKGCAKISVNGSGITADGTVQSSGQSVGGSSNSPADGDTGTSGAPSGRGTSTSTSTGTGSENVGSAATATSTP
ncbi:hypothetical protein [Kitasatospora sp. NPDC057223]|uniref:hypothetical protein n=1 Tax=Kitasatospora sp. NPDC057223 TaxID=3346055 RepID=UPI0036356A7F